jgi:hypothetical protein
MFVQLDRDKPRIGSMRGLNLPTVKPTTVLVSNCRLGMDKQVKAQSSEQAYIDRCSLFICIVHYSKVIKLIWCPYLDAV